MPLAAPSGGWGSVAIASCTDGSNASPSGEKDSIPARASAALSSAADEPDPFQQGIVGGRRLERAVEVVERRQQLLGQRRDTALLRGGGLAGDALAVVLEVGLRALGQREVLISLGGGTDQLVEIPRELGRLVAVGGPSLGLPVLRPAPRAPSPAPAASGKRSRSLRALALPRRRRRGSAPRR